ncbi:MAG: hypothetical protein ACFE8G_02185 [Candidatus Hermodarchaeota archaeon]
MGYFLGFTLVYQPPDAMKAYITAITIIAITITITMSKAPRMSNGMPNPSYLCYKRISII